jgi:hypothetical protein
MSDRYCRACEQTKPADQFYDSHPRRCKACIKADSKRTYSRRRDELRREYATRKDEHRADARLNYEANKARILLQARLRYRQGKATKTIEDEAVIVELQALLDGSKSMPTACSWCGDGRHRLDPHYEGKANKVSWLCPRCTREVKAERRKKVVHRRRTNKRPKVPAWLRRLLRQ